MTVAMHNLSLIKPEIFMALAAMALLMGGLFNKEKSSVFVLCGALATLVVALKFLPVSAIQPHGAFTNMFVTSSLIVYAKVLILGSAFLAVSYTHLRGPRDA